MPSVDLALAGRLGQLDAEGSMRLRDRLTEHDGRFYFSGSQALVRLVLDQMRRDATAGTRTGAYVTGYPGSPLAGLDIAFQREGSLMSEHGIVVAPAGSEERAVTALMGTQMLDLHPHERCDGVVGVFYGKGPGVDRSGDALRHANFAGTSKHGSVVVLSGEDHEAKSSTMPFQEEFAFMSA
ncbi:MAG: pyruvate ferredoxin oxidoreductase, partial [Actinobacteria bacterium]|nr:pyruvate ferredoxin oxidoreductase [Actinomycetota bacterium]